MRTSKGTREFIQERSLSSVQCVAKYFQGKEACVYMREFIQGRNLSNVSHVRKHLQTVATFADMK
jgi:predicted Ser/Thr protein kinase